MQPIYAYKDIEIQKCMHKLFPPTIQYHQPPKHVVDGWYIIEYSKKQKHTTTTPKRYVSNINNKRDT